MEPYRSIFDKIYEETNNLKGPTVIAVSGAYTSGKTIFANGLSEYFNARGVPTQILHYDDFHFPLPSVTWEPENSDGEVEAFYHRAFNAEKLLSEVLKPLRENHDLKKTVKGLNWSTGLYENDVPVNIDGNTIVILEGALLFRADLPPYFDYKIFLEIDEAEILKRGAARDVPQMGEWILEKYKNRVIKTKVSSILPKSIF